MSASPAPERWEKVPAEKREAYISALNHLDFGLTSNEKRAMRRGVDTCADIQHGLSGNALAEKVRVRFTGGNATVDTAKARQIVAAAKKWICGDLGKLP